MTRDTHVARHVMAGCFVCNGSDAIWTSPNAQAVAARHHDSTGHATWCDVAMTITYGHEQTDDRQTDIEDAIRGTTA